MLLAVERAKAGRRRRPVERGDLSDARCLISIAAAPPGFALRVVGVSSPSQLHLPILQYVEVGFLFKLGLCPSPSSPSPDGIGDE